MKIHPLFGLLVNEMFTTGILACRPSYEKWRSAGEPVVEEERAPQTEYWTCGAHPFAAGLIRIGTPCSLCFAGKDARIKELEAKVGELEVRAYSWVTEAGRDEIRNAALEEAAEATERLPGGCFITVNTKGNPLDEATDAVQDHLRRSAARIRALKKEAK